MKLLHIKWPILAFSGILACQAAIAADYPSDAKLSETNVALQVQGYKFGGGVYEFRDNPANSTGNGLQLLPIEWAGSGFVVQSDGTIVTNWHVATKAMSMDAVFDSGARFPVRLIKMYDPVNDVAVLKIVANKHFTPERLGNSDTVRRLDPVLAVGNTKNVGLNFTKGDVSQIVKNDYGVPIMIRHTAQIAPGNSGGPLYKGSEVVGVNESVLLDHGAQTGFAMAVPINIVKPMLSSKNAVPMKDVFYPGIKNLISKAKPVYSTTATVGGAQGEKVEQWGQWSTGGLTLGRLSDYLITVVSPENVDLDILVFSGDKIVGYGAQRITGGEFVALSSEYSMPINVVVINPYKSPVNFGFSISEIVW